MTKRMFNRDQELAFLSHFAAITSITGLDELLKTIIQETPKLLGAAGCSVYLVPEYVPQFDGSLVLKNGETIRSDQIGDRFIVLAASSRPNSLHLVGKAFYPAGQGITGWVFKTGQLLRLDDISNPKKLKTFSPDLHWSDSYGGSLDFYDKDVKKAILVVPLFDKNRTIGVLKFPATIDRKSFTPMAERIAIIVAQVISGVIRQNRVVYQQSRTIEQLLEISTINTLSLVFEAVTIKLGDMLKSHKCQLYQRTGDGNQLELIVENGKSYQNNYLTKYDRGQSLIGWVFKTGKPLCIKTLKDFIEGIYLTDEVLSEISNGTPVNDDDLEVKYIENVLFVDFITQIIVPVKGMDGTVFGVLNVEGTFGQIDSERDVPFTRIDLELAESFANIISIAIDNDHEKRLGELLTNLGRLSDPKALFKLIASELSVLVAGSYINIYEYEQSFDGSFLHLKQTSRDELSKGRGVTDLIYLSGEEKTGFFGLVHTPLIINHFGNGKTSRINLASEKQRIATQSPNDLVKDLKDDKGRVVGIIQMCNGLNSSERDQRKFIQLSRTVYVKNGFGLSFAKQVLHTGLGIRPSWSFMAVPIKETSGGFYGVITIGRSVDTSPFSSRDLSLIESIAGRLGSILQNIKMQKEREMLLVTLAHELNTPIQGIIADSENLSDDLSGTYELPELAELAQHNVDQVLRLHLLTETMMGVLTEQVPPEREFSVHSIYRPLIEAIEMFESEAKFKGCDIQKPIAIDGSRFPDIEMSLFDLTLAFKNIIHNAIKYSFSPSRLHENRFIRITGFWTNRNHGSYSISIQNFGVGITKEELETRSIFQPFTRGEKSSDRRRTGAGLGLSYAEQVINKLHHGEIKVDSKQLDGSAHLTTFTISLPLKQP